MAVEIITEESLQLASDFHHVKDEFIKRLEKQGLDHLLSPTPELGKKHIYAFDGKNKVLRYKTENILPSYQSRRKPILFVFSNPHPESVSSGLFLSEPRSGVFWQRLYETGYFQISKDQLNLTSWDESTAKKLGKLMVKGEYGGGFLFYLSCLYPIPTRQMSDFDAIFKRGKELRNSIEKDSEKKLLRLIKRYKIENIVVFTIPLFSKLTSIRKPGWRGLIKQEGNFPNFPKAEHIKQRRASLHLGGADISDINVYMALDTGFNSKNLTNSQGEYYFSSILAAIFERILASTA